MRIYSPKISDELIPIIYRIGRRERKPMTKVVDGFLRNAIDSYISGLDVDRDVVSRIIYEPYKGAKKLKAPVIGERVSTPYGTGEVIDVKYWNEIESKINDEREKEKIKDRIEFFLGDVERYFEYTVFFEEGDSATFDWTEYNGNFGKSK